METELDILRSLCDEARPREQRLILLESYARHAFAEPEHQVVYESIRALFPHGPITTACLIVHLTKRGFPDIEAEKYVSVHQTFDTHSGSND
jgi:hypothetical protein